GLGARRPRRSVRDRLRAVAQGERRLHPAGPQRPVRRVRGDQLPAAVDEPAQPPDRFGVRGVDRHRRRRHGGRGDGVPGRVDRGPQAGLGGSHRRRGGRAAAHRRRSL
ncbi:MAG: small multidrug resistance family (SMR) protein, partial [uncultured Nocardioidaceae bacterium]